MFAQIIKKNLHDLETKIIVVEKRMIFTKSTLFYCKINYRVYEKYFVCKF